MSYNGSGTFLINSAGQPVVANTVISATVFNALTSDLATGLSTAITKDGQTTITANIPFGSNKITGLGSGTATTDAANLGQVQSTAAKLITVTGTDTITGSMSPALTAYAAGQLFYFVSAGANTGPVTINIDSLGAKAITRDGATALANGDINSGEVVVVIYDGTRFQMINAANSFGNTTINGTLTVTGNTGLQANVSITSTLSVGGTFAVTGAATLGSTLAVTGKSDLPTVSTASINAAVALITTGTVTNLTATGASIASANIGNLQFTAASIASINAGVAVITNLTATGASIASANVGTAVITTGTVTNLTSTSASVASANAAVALITTGTVTNLTSTSASIASANVGTAVVTGLTVTGASIASVNVGAAVLSGNLTLNGGTANGVLYLNASKVATSGSGLTFDGTTLTSNGGFKAAGNASSLAVDGAILDFNANSTRLAAGRAGGNYSSFELYVAGASGVTKRFDAVYDTTFRWFDSAGTGELMRLNSTGLGIGTTSPLDRLDVVSGSSTNRNRVRNSTSDEAFFLFQNSTTGTTTSSGLAVGIDSSENAYLYNYINSPLIFATNSTERCRITAGGYFKASNDGTYQGSTGAYHEFRTNGSDWTILAGSTSATAANCFGIRILYGSASPNGTGNTFVNCADWNGSAVVTRAEIRSNGGLANYQSNNVDLSDARTKNSITPAASMWDKVAALEIVTYKYNDQTHDDVNVGVIAQQVESVEPVWVDADGFGDTPEGEEPLKTVYTKDITFAAIKALQEAMARIEQLEAKVAALEA